MTPNVCRGKKYEKAWKQVWSVYKHIRNLNLKCNSAKYVAGLKQYIQRWKTWLSSEYRSSFLNVVSLIYAISIKLHHPAEDILKNPRLEAKAGFQEGYRLRRSHQHIYTGLRLLLGLNQGRSDRSIHWWILGACRSPSAPQLSCYDISSESRHRHIGVDARSDSESTKLPTCTLSFHIQIPCKTQASQPHNKLHVSIEGK